MELVIRDDDAWGVQGGVKRLPGCLPLGLTFERPEETLAPALIWTVACDVLWTDPHRALGVADGRSTVKCQHAT